MAVLEFSVLKAIFYPGDNKGSKGFYRDAKAIHDPIRRNGQCFGYDGLSYYYLRRAFNPFPS
jgi:hypothetical protein